MDDPRMSLNLSSKVELKAEKIVYSNFRKKIFEVEIQILNFKLRFGRCAKLA